MTRKMQSHFDYTALDQESCAFVAERTERIHRLVRGTAAGEAGGICGLRGVPGAGGARDSPADRGAAATEPTGRIKGAVCAFLRRSSDHLEQKVKPTARHHWPRV
jgi:hypothetical protein